MSTFFAPSGSDRFSSGDNYTDTGGQQGFFAYGHGFPLSYHALPYKTRVKHFSSFYLYVDRRLLGNAIRFKFAKKVPEAYKKNSGGKPIFR
jgi:hypothetical protein